MGFTMIYPLVISETWLAEIPGRKMLILIVSMKFTWVIGNNVFLVKIQGPVIGIPSIIITRC